MLSSMSQCVRHVVRARLDFTTCRGCSPLVDVWHPVRRCGEACKGHQADRWLRSGDTMFFNAKWNQNHTHGSSDSESGSCLRL